MHTNKRGIGGGRHWGGKTEQVWNKENIQKEQEGIKTGNSFGALNDLENVGRQRVDK